MYWRWMPQGRFNLSACGKKKFIMQKMNLNSYGLPMFKLWCLIRSDYSVFCVFSFPMRMKTKLSWKNNSSVDWFFTSLRYIVLGKKLPYYSLLECKVDTPLFQDWRRIYSQSDLSLATESKYPLLLLLWMLWDHLAHTAGVPHPPCSTALVCVTALPGLVASCWGHYVLLGQR